MIVNDGSGVICCICAPAVIKKGTDQNNKEGGKNYSIMQNSRIPMLLNLYDYVKAELSHCQGFQQIDFL